MISNDDFFFLHQLPNCPNLNSSPSRFGLSDTSSSVRDGLSTMLIYILWQFGAVVKIDQSFDVRHTFRAWLSR